MVTCLKEGYVIPFTHPPPLSEKVLSLTAYQPGTERFAALEAEVSSLLAKRAIVPEEAGFYGRLFVDVSELIKFGPLTKCKWETPRSVLAAVQEGVWMTSVDLKDAYLQVPTHPGSHRSLRSCSTGRAISGGCYPSVFAQLLKSSRG